MQAGEDSDDSPRPRPARFVGASRARGDKRPLAGGCSNHTPSTYDWGGRRCRNRRYKASPAGLDKSTPPATRSPRKPHSWRYRLLIIAAHRVSMSIPVGFRPLAGLHRARFGTLRGPFRCTLVPVSVHFGHLSDAIQALYAPPVTPCSSSRTPPPRQRAPSPAELTRQPCGRRQGWRGGSG